jgi:hypothetical protein
VTVVPFPNAVPNPEREPIPEERVEALLATRRIAPSNRRVFDARLWALMTARARGPEHMREAVQAEIDAMIAAREERSRRLWKRAMFIRRADEKALRSCKYRHPLVRGLTERECQKRRQCFLCAGPLPPRRQWWCSDRCARLWTDNHEWSSVSGAAMRRDRGCVRDPGHKGPFECNHKVPRVGRGYHKGCFNHLNRVEMLCHTCHVKTTREQRRARATTKGEMGGQAGRGT